MNNNTNILWVVNTIFPDLSKKIGMQMPVSGGWMYDTAKALSTLPHINLSVATVHKDSFFNCKIDNISYFLLKSRSKLKFDSSLINQWDEVCNLVKPDLVHIHGSEYAHGLSLLTNKKKLKYVLSLQGLISVCSKYYLGGLSKKNIVLNTSFRDIASFGGILKDYYKFKSRSKLEIKYFENIDNIIGRTDWDKAHGLKLNPNANYFHCEESLRDGFYSAQKWDSSSIDKYSIFLSQANYPLKGAHNVIKAVSVLVKKYPKIKLFIAGHDLITFSSRYDKLKIQGYGKILLSLIKKNNLEENIHFTGMLSENEMIKMYQKSNVFICPSSIENSPNSIGEAQIIGTPVIASNVGGILNMVSHKHNGLVYRFHDITLLTNYISLIFDDTKYAKMISKNSIVDASKRHNRSFNIKMLLSIYNSII
tara:strand:+ start:12369 stop:13631 length:1263 start_codon:yes stop_codon:yes gene_type:complete